MSSFSTAVRNCTHCRVSLRRQHLRSTGTTRAVTALVTKVYATNSGGARSRTFSVDPCSAKSTRRFATSTTPHSTAVDPAHTEAFQCIEKGIQKLEEGDVEGAKGLFQRAVEIKRGADSLFNLGVTHYHLKEYDEAIKSWKESIELQPSSSDAHTNLASAYIVSPVPRPALALHHLRVATALAPEDPEIAFNLAAVLEACGRLEEALTHYKRSKANGVDRAEAHIQNLSAKIQRQKAQNSTDEPLP